MPLLSFPVTNRAAYLLVCAIELEPGPEPVIKVVGSHFVEGFGRVATFATCAPFQGGGQSNAIKTLTVGIGMAVGTVGLAEMIRRKRSLEASLDLGFMQVAVTAIDLEVRAG